MLGQWCFETVRGYHTDGAGTRDANPCKQYCKFKHAVLRRRAVTWLAADGGVLRRRCRARGLCGSVTLTIISVDKPVASSPRGRLPVEGGKPDQFQDRSGERLQGKVPGRG